MGMEPVAMLSLYSNTSWQPSPGPYLVQLGVEALPWRTGCTSSTTPGESSQLQLDLMEARVSSVFFMLSMSAWSDLGGCRGRQQQTWRCSSTGSTVSFTHAQDVEPGQDGLRQMSTFSAGHAGVVSSNGISSSHDSTSSLE